MKLSVHIVTYKHEDFIAQALDGVLMQQVNFDYEIVIGEDCSPDRTGEIVREYAARHPDKIRALPREKNLGGRKNWLDVLANCRGEYIALLDGDDYWTSPYKLQKQVDLLDARPDLVSCFHPVTVTDITGRQEDYVLYPPDRRPEYKLADLGEKNFMMTCSVVFRNGLMKEVPEPLKTAPMGDWLLHSYNAQFGGIGYIDEDMGRYRVHPGGVFFHRRLDLIKRGISDNKCAEAIVEMVGPAAAPDFLPHVAHRYYTIAVMQMRKNDQSGARDAANNAWRYRRYSQKYRVVQIAKLRVRAYFPWMDKPIKVAEKLVTYGRRVRARLMPS